MILLFFYLLIDIILLNISFSFCVMVVFCVCVCVCYRICVGYFRESHVICRNCFLKCYFYSSITILLLILTVNHKIPSITTLLRLKMK